MAAPARRREAGSNGLPVLEGHQRGLSLIELMVVIAIILLLSAIILPALEAALEKGESTSCLANLHHLAMAARLYADDYDDRIVPARLPTGGPTTVCWDVTIQPYLNNRLILLCPSDETPRRLSNAICELHSYGINLELAEVGGYLGSALRLSDLNNSAGCVLFCELNGQRFATHGVHYAVDGLQRVAVRRHGNGANYAFADGHTKWLLPERTEQPDNAWHP